MRDASAEWFCEFLQYRNSFKNIGINECSILAPHFFCQLIKLTNKFTHTGALYMYILINQLILIATSMSLI